MLSDIFKSSRFDENSILTPNKIAVVLRGFSQHHLWIQRKKSSLDSKKERRFSLDSEKISGHKEKPLWIQRDNAL